MDKEFSALIEDYVNLKVKDPKIRSKVIDELIEEFESDKGFSEQLDGSFKMYDGHFGHEVTFEDVADWLKNSPTVKACIDGYNKSSKELGR